MFSSYKTRPRKLLLFLFRSSQALSLGGFIYVLGGIGENDEASSTVFKLEDGKWRDTGISVPMSSDPNHAYRRYPEVRPAPVVTRYQLQCAEDPIDNGEPGKPSIFYLYSFLACTLF